jgi:hypothetical protein
MNSTFHVVLLLDAVPGHFAAQHPDSGLKEQPRFSGIGGRLLKSPVAFILYASSGL